MKTRNVILFIYVLTLATSAFAADKATVDFYGYIKADASYDTKATNLGDFARWVNPTPAAASGQFNLTGNQTRFGVKIKGPDTDHWKLSGQIESDLYGLQGGAGQENKSYAMFRHFFMEAACQETGITFLAGQTWDVVGPLNPDTVNYAVQWWAGNPGYRRPQLRLTKVLSLAKDTNFKIEAAAVRVIGHDAEATVTDPASTTATGNDSIAPGVQARASLSMPLLTSAPATFGFGVHHARERYNSGAFDELVTQDLFVADMLLPLAEGLTLKGEYYWGQNADSLSAGGVGLNTTTRMPIKTKGGWAQLGISAITDFTFNLGGSVDTVDSATAKTATCIRNGSYYGNVFYNVTPTYQTAFEVSKWQTAYLHGLDNSSMRYQAAFIYKF